MLYNSHLLQSFMVLITEINLKYFNQKKLLKQLTDDAMQLVLNESKVKI